ncbi:MAG: bifunctional chorismate mutase/prephenate dehydratase [Clostridia bacterium]|nr:bifunctional chorismate mutase/prephenate dehydratase [Clostridia bacterium]
MKDIKELRGSIDSTDAKIVELLKERMQLSREVAEYKREKNVPVFDGARERALLDKIEDMAGEECGGYARRLYITMLELSRAYQNKILEPTSSLSKAVSEALESTPKMFPERAFVACQGVEGAYSQQACDKLFKKPSIMYCTTFESVFQTVKNGLCKYGVVPVENSNAGTVNLIYELMEKYNMTIVKSTNLQVLHSLLGNTTDISKIKEIFSHSQAIAQCSDFLGNHKDIKVTPVENTAVAAKMVRDSGRDDIAAIASPSCVEQYGMKTIDESIQNNDNNRTRFICFSKELEIYPGADKTSLLLRIPHKPGSLYQIISYFNSLGLNLLKLESRPIAGRDFEFMFYFDVGVSVYSPELLLLLDHLEYSLGRDRVQYLGSYLEA